MRDIISPLVSEAVMGWHREILQNNERDDPYYASYWVDNNGEKQKPENFWNPATDIADALKVIEHLRSIGILLTLETLAKEYKVSCNGEFDTFCASAPLAICVAALKSVGKQIADVYTETK